MIEFHQLSFTVKRTTEAAPKLVAIKDLPTADQWKKLVRQQIGKIKKGNIKKVVLARETKLKFAQSINAGAVLKRLTDSSINCYHFYFQPSASTVFLGASPERLYKRQGLTIHSEALAGTRARGKTLSDDKSLKDALLNSEKDWHEHSLVADWIRNVLNPMCSQLQVDRTFSVVSLKSGHHLITRMQGRLLETIDDAMLLERLHPTPAVAGWPKEEALQIIRKVEPFSRGYYAAPVGYIGYDEAEFAVAIRSGLIKDNEVRLHAGAGIVDASKANEEWEETNNKLQLFLTALGL